MKIMKFGDFASIENMNEGYFFINEDEMSDDSYSTTNSEDAFNLKGADTNKSNYTFTKDGITFDFTDLYVNFINKTI